MDTPGSTSPELTRRARPKVGEDAMPSVCIHYGPDQHTSRRDFSDLAEALAASIESCLGANREKIQIMPVRLAHPPLGRPVYIEIKARDSKARGDEVLRRFIGQVDEITFQAFGTRCRIRYFRYPGEFLAAAN